MSNAPIPAAAFQSAGDFHDQPADRPLPMTGAPSPEQIHELATMVRSGDLSPRQRDRLAELLHNMGTAARVAPEGKRRYPHDPGMAAIYEVSCWEPVAADFAALIEIVAR